MPYNMPSGKQAFTHLKDKKIAVYKNVNPQASGTSPKIWQPISAQKLWANYRSLSGNEKFAAKTAGFTEEVVFTINWRGEIAQGLHIVYRDKIYEVTRVDDFEGYKKDLRLVCKLAPNVKLSDYPVL